MIVPFRKRIGSAYNFKAAVMLRRLIAREHYDLIITHTSLASFFTRLSVKGLRKRPPLCSVIHGYLFDEDTPHTRRRILETAEKMMIPETDLLLTMNRWDYGYAMKNRLAKRVERIPGMGVDFAKFDHVSDSRETLRDRFGLPRDAFVLVYAAEFSERKSQSVLIEAMSALPEKVYLVLAGEGAYLDVCRTKVKQLGLGDRVRFAGYVGEMGLLYRVADASVSASRFEGLPFNVMEAMYCAIPVVASRVKGHVDLIEDGVSGLLYEYGDVEACVRQLRRLMADPSLRQRLAQTAKARVAEYRLELVKPQVMSMYMSLVDGARRETT